MLTSQLIGPERHSELDLVRALFREYGLELAIDLCFQGFEEELKNLPGKYTLPLGELRLYYADMDLVGCGAFRPLNTDTAELKRIYVRPEFRGRGFGREITLGLIKACEAAGYRLIRLDTLRRLVPAVNLYHNLGFIEIEAYNETPIDDVVYMEYQVQKPLYTIEDQEPEVPTT